MFHKTKMGSIIRSTGTVFYSLLCINSPWLLGFNGLKYVYSVISVIDNSLSGNTKSRESLRSWTARVRLVHSWAARGGHFNFLLTPRWGWWFSNRRRREFSLYKEGGLWWYKTWFIWIWGHIFEFRRHFFEFWSHIFEFWRQNWQQRFFDSEGY